MSPLQKIQDVLKDEIQDQCFYNEQAVHITDPALRQFFFQMRDDKMKNITLLQSEIQKLMQPEKG